MIDRSLAGRCIAGADHGAAGPVPHSGLDGVGLRRVSDTDFGRELGLHRGPAGAGCCRRGLARPRSQRPERGIERGIVGEDGAAGQHMACDASASGPSSMVALPTQPGQRRTLRFDPVAREDAGLAVQRKVTAILRGRHMRQEAGDGRTLTNFSHRPTVGVFFRAVPPPRSGGGNEASSGAECHKGGKAKRSRNTDFR